MNEFAGGTNGMYSGLSFQTKQLDSCIPRGWELLENALLNGVEMGRAVGLIYRI
jgi:hypothetical protein